LVAKIEIIPKPEEEGSKIVNTFELGQNYPNPFNSTTTISYSIEKSSWVVITIYDALGREITRLENSYKETGSYQTVWDGKIKQGEEVATGIYYYQLLAESFKDTKKLMIQK
jgi:flagellar hook assembly protein FlgD